MIDIFQEMYKMKKWFLCIGLALFIGAFIGCKKESPTESPTEPEIEYTIENYFPLAVGNEWIYRDISYDPLDSVTPYDTTIDTMAVVETYKWEGKNVFEVTIAGQSGLDYYVYYDGELRVYEDPPEQDSMHMVFLKEPLEEGKSWEFVPSIGTTCEVVSTEFTLNTPAGDFTDCIKIDIEIGEETYFVYAPGVGWVKWYQRWFNGMWCEIVILEYDIK